MKKNLRKFKYYLLYHYKKNLSVEKRKNYISKRYAKKIGSEIDWISPKTYTEKIQCSKFSNHSKIISDLTDKVEVRNWIKNKIGEEYLVPLIGVYNNAEEINFNLLPEKYVIKTNHGSGTNIIINNKKNIDKKKIMRTLNDWLDKDFAYMSDFELHYSNIQPKIIIEKYLDGGNETLSDYKFLCFNSEVYYCWVDMDRFTHHTRNIYNIDWELQPFRQLYSNYDGEIEKPENFDEMVKIARKLCEGFGHVRVDLYNLKGKIYFGEMTFTNGGGYEFIAPKEYDLALGSLWNIQSDNGGNV